MLIGMFITIENATLSAKIFRYRGMAVWHCVCSHWEDGMISVVSLYFSFIIYKKIERVLLYINQNIEPKNQMEEE